MKAAPPIYAQSTKNILSIYAPANRITLILVAGLWIAVADWGTKPYIFLGFLYLFPSMILGGFLPRIQIPGVQRIALGSKRVSEPVLGATRSASKDASAIRAGAVAFRLLPKKATKGNRFGVFGRMFTGCGAGLRWHDCRRIQTGTGVADSIWPN